MARHEIAHHLPTVKDGDADCDAFQPCELSSRRTFDCGSQMPATSHERNQLLLTDNGSSTPKNMRRDVSAQQNFKENILHDLASGVQTFNVHRRDGKIAAKLQFLMRRTSATSVFLDVKLCVRGNGLSVSSCSISRSFLFNKTHVPRTLFQDLFNKKLQQKNPPLLQWYNHNPKRQKEVHEDEKNSELQQELGYNSMHITSLEIEVNNLKEKLTQQSRELKVCHDQVLELKGNIRVFCRCRPLTSDEVIAGDKSVIEFNAVHNNELYVHTHEGVKKPFKFDCVFTPSHNQEDVFRETAPLVVSVLDGFNVCIFAYGQTGTGKTFTMEGSKDNRGVNYRTLEKLFHLASERKGHCTYDISVSVVEVYNEEIRDLLAPLRLSGQSSKKLEIKRVVEGTHHLPGVVESTVHSIEDVWKVLQIGSKARVVGCTNANKHSSRSHCMLCVTVKGENLLTKECTQSKLWLIDLAGSERIGKTDVQGDRLKEAQSINKSLSALGDVVHALASKSSHIPYRNSKITHLLQDSLGGQSKTLMFVQISPSDRDVGETLCSLNFATRVRGVDLGAARKQIDPAELLKYKKLAEKAKQDGFLKDETIKELQDGAKAKEQTCKALAAKVKEKENLIEAEKKARSMAEDKLKEQHTLIEKQKQLIEKLLAEIKAKKFGLLQEPMGQKITPGLKASTPRRSPLQERLTDNREQVPETNQRLKKRAAEGYAQKENSYSETDAAVLPSKTLPRRASMSTMPHQWPSTPGAVPLLSGPLPKRRAFQQSDQQDAPEETFASRITSKRQGRASLCALPQRQPSSWAIAAPPPSPLLKFAEPRRRSSMVCPTAPSSVVRANLPAAMILPLHMQSKEPQKVLFRSPLEHKPGTQDYCANGNVEMNDYSNVVSRGGEPHGMPKARRVSNINVAHGKPPQHPHQDVNRELQNQPKRLISQAGEEVDDRLKKTRRLSATVPPLPWERPLPTPTTPSRIPTSGDAQRILGIENQKANSAGRLSIASSVPWEKVQQIWATTPATPAHIPMLDGAERVLLTDKRSRFPRREVSRGWNR